MADMEMTMLPPAAVPSKMGSGPLAVLKGGALTSAGVKTINYPSTLGDRNLNHYVVFFIKDIESQDFSKDLASQISSASNTYNNITREAQLKDTENALDPNALGQSAFGTAIKAVTENLSILHNRQKAKAYISLYMPDSLKDSFQSDYAPISIRDELGSILGAIRTAASVADTIKTSGEPFAKAIASDPAAIKFTIDTFVNAVGGGGGIGEALLQAQGYTSNPQLQMIYRGTHFRQFTLDFLFTPTSEPEAEVVREIIYLFKFFAAPTISVGQKAKGGMFLTPPSLFEIKFMNGKSENINLPKYTDCVLEDVSVDYAPNGFAAHTDGAPIQTHLTLTFQEVEIVDRGRLTDGFEGNVQGGLR
jgi:hypothetical protein